MGLRYMRKFQLGREVSAGTGVAATTIWRGKGAIEDRLVHKYSDQNLGVLTRIDSSYISQYQAAAIFDADAASFEQILHIFEAGIETESASADAGGGSGKIWEYDFPTTAAKTIKTYTIEGGDDIQEEEFSYGFVDSFNLVGAPGEAWMLDAVWLGRQVSTSTFTAGQSAPTVDYMQFLKTKLYIDAINGTYGTTLKSNTLLEASIACKTGWIPVWAADGQLYFSTIKCVGPEVTVDCTFEYDATSVAQIANWRAGTSIKLCLKCEGSALTTPGTAYTYRTFKLDLPGSWDKFDKLDERDGNDIVHGVFRGGYNATAGDSGKITVVNEVATVP